MLDSAGQMRIFAPFHFKNLNTMPKLMWIYLLYSDAFPFRYKIGITERHVQHRIFDIEHSIKKETGDNVKIRKFIAIPSLFAYKLEQFLHRKFSKFNSRMPGSGGTEWFLWGNVLFCAIYLLLVYCYKLNLSNAYGTILILIPLPLDFALLLFLIMIIETTAVIGSIILLITFINQLT